MSASLSRLLHNPSIQHVEKVIADNTRFLRDNTADSFSRQVAKYEKKAAQGSRGWIKSALMAIGVYIIGRTLFNALLPKPEAGADFEKPDKQPASLTGQALIIGALTAAFKWFGKR